jgi:alkylresorcinol/alkylpyrone synthase
MNSFGPPRLLSLTTAVPSHRLEQNDVLPVAQSHFGPNNPNFARLMSVYRNAAVETRYSCVPLNWYTSNHTFRERNQLYIENATTLLVDAARRAIAEAGLEIADIGGIVTVSSTGVATPSLDALVMERLQLPRDIVRLPIFGLGCAGGVVGLSRAAALARAEPARRILFLVVELCGLTFRHNDFSKSNIVATALFGDGAAGAIIGCQGNGPAIEHWGEYTWPATLGMMGWDVREDGLAVIFSRDIPTFVRREMNVALERFLATNDIAKEDIDTFVSHPGGAKVIDALEEIFGMAPGDLVDARAVLRDFGNMSAATVLFVLRRTLDTNRAGGRTLLTTLGPGFSAGFLTLHA